MIIHDLTGIQVIDREIVLDNEPFFLQLATLQQRNGRPAYGCFAIRHLPGENIPRDSHRTEVYSTREEAMSEGWELYLSLNPTHEGTHSYVGRKKCGCIASVASESWPGLLDDIKKWRKHGQLIDRVTHQHVRENFQGRYCAHEPEQKSLFEVTQ